MATSARRLAGFTAALFLAAGSAGAQAVRGGPLPGPLPLFPPDSWWNLDISSAPVDPNSAAYISFVGTTRGLHPDFGGDSSPAPEIYGMVTMTVPGSQPLEPMTFDYAGESDPGAPGRPPGYPIPVEAKTQSKWIEGGYPGNAGMGGDKHMLIVDSDHRILFETWDTRCLPVGSASCSWFAGSGAVFPLDSIARRPDGWTSADAAGLAILPGLVRYDEAFGTVPIGHAFRFTVSATNGYVWPASHRAGSTSGALPMGARLRLKAGKDLSGYTPAVQRIFQAMKTYGLIVADNGSDLFVQGTYDTRWDNGVLNPAFGSLKGSDFEVVQLGWKPPAGGTAGPLGFFPLAPCRLIDTRDPPGPRGGPPIAATAERVFAVAGVCGLPVDARAVSLNVTVTGADSAGGFRLFPGDAAAPVANAVSYQAGATRASNVVVKLSASGTGTFAVHSDQLSGAAQLVVDVNGFFK
jgi:predicted secreted protein